MNKIDELCINAQLHAKLARIQARAASARVPANETLYSLLDAHVQPFAEMLERSLLANRYGFEALDSHTGEVLFYLRPRGQTGEIEQTIWDPYYWPLAINGLPVSPLHWRCLMSENTRPTTGYKFINRLDTI